MTTRAKLFAALAAAIALTVALSLTTDTWRDGTLDPEVITREAP